ncbi:MAG TPA: (deoxy)nucleoside triphosphate pyrophosphohydrolase [Acidimicrobiia bacterium]|nr:(deoxy)nucleoside triphosphate pyrophosphohydrolase [Acidimicrobiia bacterium]
MNPHPHVTPSPPLHVVAGLLRREDRVLLCHRRPDRSHYPNVWDLPGGRVEPGETLVDALTRELEEELGIVPELSEKTPWLTLTDDDLRLHVYLVDDWTGEPSNLAPEEHDEIRWTRSDEMGDLTLADSSYSEMLERALT